jgi:hypothetical protein
MMIFRTIRVFRTVGVFRTIRFFRRRAGVSTWESIVVMAG